MKPKILIVIFFIFTLLFQITPVQATTHFTPVWETENPFNPMNFLIISVEGISLESGDEIGVFDNALCVGAGVVTGSISIQNPLTIIASQDDGTGKGFTEGHTISFQIWDVSQIALIKNISPTFMDMKVNPVSPTPTFQGNKDYSVKLAFTGTAVLSVTPAFINVSDAAGTTFFNVSNTGSGDMTWKASSNTAWLRIVDGDNGINNGIVRANYFENTGIQRTGSITVTASGATGSPHTVKVIQGLPGVIMKVGKGAGKTTEPVPVNITAEGEGVDLSKISGAVFTLEYDSDLFLESVESKFFDTFQAQIDEANPPASPSVPAEKQPVIFNTYDTSATTKTMVSAARGISTSNSQAAGNVLFTLNFRLNEGITEETYPIGIVPTILNSPAAGYDSNGEKVDLLIGYDNDAFQKLIKADNYEKQTVKGSIAFGNCIITPSAGKGGTITPADMVVADCGSTKEFVIKADPCYYIKDILVDGNSLGNDIVGKTEVGHNIIAKEKHTISAEFEAYTYNLTFIKADAGGTVSYLDAAGIPLPLPESGIITANCGSDITLIITPAKCYHIDKILKDNAAVPKDQYEIIEDNKASYTIKNITADHTVQTQFTGVDKVTITAAVNDETLGSIEPSGKIELACGGGQTFTISPKDSTCDSVKDVLVDSISRGDIKTYSFADVVSDRTINVNFEKKTYNVKVIAEAGGKIDPTGDADGNVLVGCKSSPVFTIIPDECHTIKSVKVDGVLFGAISEYPFYSVTKDHTLEAGFNTKSLTIITSAEGNGNILSEGEIVSGPLATDCGVDKTFYMKPNPGYHVADVIVEGQSKGMITSYTFKKITKNYTMVAKFEANLPGDIDGNKKVELADAVLGLKILAGIQSAANVQIGADVNADGKISISEVIYVLRKVVGL